MRALLTAGLALVVALSAVHWISRRAPHPSSPLARLALPIPRCTMGSDPLRVFVRKQETPCILADSDKLVGSWKALQRWSVKHLTDNVDSWTNVYRKHGPIFGPHYDASRVFAQLDSVHPQQGHHERVNLTGQAFYHRLVSAPSMEDMLLFTGNFGDIHARYNLLEDLEGFERNFELDPKSGKQNINLWVGARGQITHLHYDSYVNFNVQIVGEKVWTLIAPNSEMSVRPFPFLHPSHAQSRLPSLEVLHLPSHMEVFQETLKKGDVLYIPALWWHHVEAVSLSVSVNFWSMSEESGPVAQIFHHLESLRLWENLRNGKHHDAIVWAKAIIVSILDDIYLDEEDGPATFIQHLYMARYEGLVLLAEASNQRLDEFCARKILVDEDMQALARESVQAVIQLLSQLPPLIRDVWLGHVVESIAVWSLSPPLVQPFLRLCFL
jgi:hypothetical protein